MPASPATARQRPITHRVRHVARNARDRFLRTGSLVQANQLAFDVVHDNGLVQLRHYRPLQESSVLMDGKAMPVVTQRQRVPLVIVPPLAVNMSIYDLFPDRSLVKYFLARGFDVYLIDWGVPRMRHTHYSLETYAVHLMPEFLTAVRTHSGQQDLSLHGWSLGGIISLCYAALTHDTHIRNMVILGAPINTHASGAIGKFYQSVKRKADRVERRTGWRIHDVPSALLHTPGWFNVVGFKMTNPVGSLMGYWELLRKLGDREFVSDHATQSAFLDNMVSYPGGVVKDMISRLWIANEFSTGTLNIAGTEARLADIKASLFAIGGQGDNMVTRPAIEALLGLVGTEDKVFLHAPGGHMGILSGSKAPSTIWAPLADWLAERSQ
ncbi:MAG TPA: alpha/beta fold hydrolase [Moraxellaceae bacterium]|nr:alpha/beta fold hydrolase [Moraxellaceae bacterium]